MQHCKLVLSYMTCVAGSIQAYNQEFSRAGVQSNKKGT